MSDDKIGTLQFPPLPVGDHTPRGYELPRTGIVERAVKAPIRRFGYPVYNFFVSRALDAAYGGVSSFPVDRWLWGQRGNDYAAHRRRVNRILPLAGSDVLVAGCGAGRDVLSWLQYQPASITGVDYLDYSGAWRILQDHVAERFPHVRIDFVQGDLRQLDRIPENSVDLVASDAVFEHIRDLPLALAEFHRILRPGGVLYATFGPLWYCWHGDHVSGYDALGAGYNHLILPPDQYEAYIAADTVHDGRFWREHDLFSYLRPQEYLNALDGAGFTREFVGVLISPPAVKCLRLYPELRARLSAVAGPLDLIVAGMTIIYRKPAEG